jgi:hypothetical protein
MTSRARQLVKINFPADEDETRQVQSYKKNLYFFLLPPATANLKNSESEESV